MTVKDGTASFIAGLRSETIAYRDAVEVYEKRRDRWQKMIVDAVDDQHMTIKDIAALVGVSTSRIHTIIARISSLPG